MSPMLLEQCRLIKETVTPILNEQLKLNKV